ncbi:cysteine desulfurase family protein [Aurantiacibacter poecillastricola]|uniref:cysteine desulfurase family protein n=1 Tax=Aurantiacibacter poecillastricola TaxID=3064385 RepID=UPI00273D9C25|nr:aminotransferase class V-fold PLP-dependent enzyme [Aurantiacibacter sp. 219JJ12-13]MDP5262554.1 aminotransferase class V-fold PLP-dependent enzyme [Aurantiacibacter sp. 219JJ12-13]
MNSRIYLDHAATTPLRPEAKAAMEEGFAIWANPSSPHAEGRKARAALEDARQRSKAALGWDGELIFTSGSSEALSIALNRTKMERRIVSAVEHDAVFRAAPDATVMPVENGMAVLPADASAAVVALQQVNSETGAMMLELGDVYSRVSEGGALLLADCSQGGGKHELPSCDMAVVSAHKLGGPVGIGALLVRDYGLLEPVGGHERGYRQGTENLPAAMGFAAALEQGSLESWVTTREQRSAFAEKLSGSRLVTGQVHCDYILSLYHETISAQALLVRLDAMGFAVSAGSACSSGTLKKSKVLDAFGVPDDVASRTIRVSLGWNTTPEELDAFADAWSSLT